MSRLLNLFGVGAPAQVEEELNKAVVERVDARVECDSERSISTRSVAIASRAHRKVVHDLDKALQELRADDSISRFLKH